MGLFRHHLCSLVLIGEILPLLLGGFSGAVLSSANAATNKSESAFGEKTNGIPEELQDAKITEHLGSQVTINEFQFLNEKSEQVLFSSYFNRNKPILLALVYYECPNLCNFMLNGLLQSLKTLDWTPGKNFDIVAVSINPKETPKLASEKKEAYLKAYGRPEAASGWHFLTGEENQIQKLASQVGFGYKYDAREKQYAHSAALFVLTPSGKISRYLYGIEYPSKDLRLALLEASDGKIGTVMDRFLLYCFHYDPHTKQYSIYVVRLMYAACIATVLGLGFYLGIFWRRQRKGAQVNAV